MKAENNFIFIFVLFFCINFFARSEFYFVRHGQTDFNKGIEKTYWNMPMNSVGIEQIESLQNIVANLPIEVIYYSPLKRTVQTKNILNSVLHVACVRLPEFKEPKENFFLDLMSNSTNPGIISKKLQLFLNNISKGITEILNDSRIALVVAHGKVYAALCHILDIETDMITIKNGALVHFYQANDGDWKIDIIAYGFKK